MKGRVFPLKTINVKLVPPKGLTILTSMLVIALSGLFLVQSQICWAHSRLKSATIQPGAVLTTVPATLSLTFTEETSTDQTKLQVLDSAGKVVDKGDLKVNGATATISLGNLADGSYTVKFRTFTEDDSGIVNGEYSFKVARSESAAAGGAQAKEEESVAPSVPASGQGGSSQLERNSNGPSQLLTLGFISLLIFGAGVSFWRLRSVR